MKDWSVVERLVIAFILGIFALFFTIMHFDVKLNQRIALERYDLELSYGEALCIDFDDLRDYKVQVGQ